MIRITHITHNDDSYKDVFIVAGRVSNMMARKIVVHIDGEQLGAAELTKSQDGVLEFHFLRQYLTKEGKRKCLLKVFDNRGRAIGEKSVFFYGTPIRLYMDKPVAGSVVSDVIDIRGWIASLHSIRKYRVRVKGKSGVCLFSYESSLLRAREDLAHLRTPCCGGFDVRACANLIESGGLYVTLAVEDVAGNCDTKTVPVTYKSSSTKAFNHCYRFLCR